MHIEGRYQFAVQERLSSRGLKREEIVHVMSIIVVWYADIWGGRRKQNKGAVPVQEHRHDANPVHELGE
jgi:hypothetical protein